MVFDMPRPLRNTLWECLTVIVVISAVTFCCWFIPINYLALGYFYILAVIALSLIVGRKAAFLGVVYSSLAWNFFIVPPRMSFSTPRFDELLLMAIFFAVAFVGSQLAAMRAVVDRAAILTQSQRMYQTLFDSVAHELKTPLSVFRTAVDELDAEGAEKHKPLIAEIKIAVDRLENMVGNLLNQTRLESGVLKPRLDWCDCRDVVAAARRSIGNQMGNHPIAVEIPPDLPPFFADAALLEQVVALLLLNAAVHTSPDTAIKVTASESQGPKCVHLNIIDHGPGIPPELHEKIFEKFSRGPNPRRGGLGLGLSIVRGFMSAQGGAVSVQSPPGGGTCFTLHIPCAQDAALPSA